MKDDDIYDIIYDDYEVPTRNVYNSAFAYNQRDSSKCNMSIQLPPLSLRTLQTQIIPYWFKYMVAL